MANPQRPKRRITVSDLEAVEVGTASLPQATPDGGSEAVEDDGSLAHLPAGVSPEVAKLLATPEPDPEPEAEPESERTSGGTPGVADQAPAAAPAPRRGRVALALAIVVVGAGAAVGGWFASRPPPLDLREYSGEEIAVRDVRSPVGEMTFVPIPVEGSGADEAGSAEEAGSNRSSRSGDRPRSSRTRVRGEDLF